MERKIVIRCVLAIVLLIYIGFALAYSDTRASGQVCRGVSVTINDPGHNGFVAVSDILRDLTEQKTKPEGIGMRKIDVQSIENTLAGCDNIESVNCVLLTNDTLLIEVQPLKPLVRVFDRNNQDYYINRAGKRMNASVHYRIDVPVVSGEFSEALKPTVVLPYIDYFTAHPGWDRLVSALQVTPGGDIIMIPAIKGHVVNLGDTTDIDNKFRRLRSFYSQVMPVKGWQYYDTLSVKWRSRVIATRRGFKHVEEAPLTEENIDFDDISTMNAGNDSLVAIRPDNNP